MSVNILSYERPRHQIDTKKGGKMGEYRFPVRYVMDDDDDDIISGLKRMPEKAPCIFCLGHSYSDNCTKFLTPASRLRRLRNINYTLFLNGVLQVCPCCLSRFETCSSNLCLRYVFYMFLEKLVILDTSFARNAANAITVKVPITNLQFAPLQRTLYVF